MKSLRTHALRLAALWLMGLLALQAVFAVRVGLMAVVDPRSTTFQRSEIARLLLQKHEVAWSQQWADGDAIAATLKRAVIASEDAGFTEHSGVEWDALEKAWEKNQRSQAQAERRSQQLEERAARSGAKPGAAAATVKPPKVVGGSTISQQLAKNLFLSGERTLPRKAQEFAITFMLEALLPKARILEIYLNHVEWGEGLFGAQAAARHYFRKDAAKLGADEAARLAVMLPAPKRFEQRFQSPYLLGRAATVRERMGAVDLP